MCQCRPFGWRGETDLGEHHHRVRNILETRESNRAGASLKRRHLKQERQKRLARRGVHFTVRLPIRMPILVHHLPPGKHLIPSDERPQSTLLFRPLGPAFDDEVRQRTNARAQRLTCIDTCARGKARWGVRRCLCDERRRYYRGVSGGTLNERGGRLTAFLSYCPKEEGRVYANDTREESAKRQQWTV